MKKILLAGAALAAFGLTSLRAAELTLPNYGPWGFDVSGMDRAAKPGNNFFEFANGTAVRNLVIPPDQSSYGSFNILRDLSEAREHAILEDAAKTAAEAPSAPVAKSGAFYRAFMDEAAAEKLGAAPMKTHLDEIRAISTPTDFARLQGQGQKTLLPSLFGMAITPDSKDPTKYSIGIGQAGLGLPDRDYYIESQFADKRGKYQGFVATMLRLAGWPDADAAAKRVVDLEGRIAAVSWSRADRRDDDKTYNPVAVADLKKQAPGFDWDAYFAAADLGKPDRVVLAENTAIAKIAAIAGSTPVASWKDWSAFHLALNSAPFLSKAFVDADFQFMSHELEGQPQQKPRWKRAVHTVDAMMGEAIGQDYVRRYYPPDAQAKMAALTHDLRDAFHARLQHIDWMSPATRDQALEKLSTFDFQIGYPKKWRDYSALAINAHDLYGNVERSTAFEWAFWVRHLGHPVDRDLWEMFPQTVNAYNEPVFNEVVFPAAILQPPFFNNAADPAINYGAIGGVIGHEMTHSFDDQGRKHDAQGRLHDWWTKEDAQRFDERAKKFGAEYARMEILPGAHINPALTMGENIADLGGLTLALDAYHASLHGKPAPVVGGMTGDQRVFLGWAQVWRSKLRDDATRQRLVVDPHSPPVARVNGPSQNIDAWYTAFDVKPGETHYLPPEQRVKIW